MTSRSVSASGPNSLFGNAMAAGACAGGVAIANLVAPGLAWAALAAFPVLVAAREFADQNRTIARWWRTARTTLPATSGEVIVRGITRVLDTKTVALYSRRECLGYWAQFTSWWRSATRRSSSPLIARG